MKYSITPETSLIKIPKELDEVHFVRPPKATYLEKLINKCKLTRVSMSRSCFVRMGGRAKKLFKENEIAIIIEENRGRAIEIDMQKLVKVIGMYRDDKSFREIEEEMQVPKSTAHYLVRYAERTKIKDGEDTVYLQKLE